MLVGGGARKHEVWIPGRAGVLARSLCQACYRDCTRGRARLATGFFAGIIMLRSHGYDGSNWYVLHGLLTRQLIRVHRSPFSSANISSFVAHLECQLEPASCMHLHVRAHMRTNTSRQGRGLFGCRTVGPSHRHLEIGAGFITLLTSTCLLLRSLHSGSP